MSREQIRLPSVHGDAILDSGRNRTVRTIDRRSDEAYSSRWADLAFGNCLTIVPVNFISRRTSSEAFSAAHIVKGIRDPGPPPSMGPRRPPMFAMGQRRPCGWCPTSTWARCPSHHGPVRLPKGIRINP
jgi:hypothetical protein